jgi:phage terminase small subunit
MAGTTGKSGGARPGAGRKKKIVEESAKVTPGAAAVSVSLEPQPGGGALKRSNAEPVPLPKMDMLQMLQAVALGHVEATNTQVRAAIAAVQYTHTKKGEGGKKDEAADKAKQAGQGKYATPPAPPRMVVNNK